MPHSAAARGALSRLTPAAGTPTTIAFRCDGRHGTLKPLGHGKSDPAILRGLDGGSMRGAQMRMMMKVQIPVAAGSQAIADGRLPEVVQKTMEKLKPEAA